MLSLAIIARDPGDCSAIEHVAEASGIFKVVARLAPIPTVPEVSRILQIQAPQVILLDLSDREAISFLATQIQKLGLKTTVVGFAPSWTRAEQAACESLGILASITAPFSAEQLEACVFDALHREAPTRPSNILAFLPSKAGGGSSTVALNTAAALASQPSGAKRVLLIEADRRSGIFSILLNLRDRDGLPEALKKVGDLTALEWNRCIVNVCGVDLMPANPMRRGPLPTWADYFQLLSFAAERYDHIVVDLPEVVNSATAELVRSARATFITCTPELPSLAMARLRLSELEACEVPRRNVNVLVNRYERGGLPLAEVETVLGGEVFATLPNDYREVKKSIMESRLVSASSGFGKSCAVLAQKIGEIGQTVPPASRFSLIRRLTALTGALS